MSILNILNHILLKYCIGLKLYKINILQIEEQRLRGLQLECNELLDKFYPSKNEFDFLVKEALLLKYLGEDDYLSSETNIQEFSLFIKSVWQMAKYRFLDKGKTTKYISFIGSPLEEVLITVRNFVDEIQFCLTYMSYHSECSNTLHSICNQIMRELKGDCFTTAETCLRQYTYLQAALPFLHKLRSLINQYLLSNNVHTPKEFVDRIILQIPYIDGLRFEEDCNDMAPFRFTVELLNGKLMDIDVLDHNSEIKPVVEDDTNLKKSIIVIETVNWIMQQYKTESVPRAFKNFVVPTDFPNTMKSRSPEVNSFGSPRCFRSPRLLHPNSPDVNDLSNQFGSPNSDWIRTSISPTSFNHRGGRRGRRAKKGINSTNDLQPIIVHTLQSPILQPLL